MGSGLLEAHGGVDAASLKSLIDGYGILSIALYASDTDF